PQGTLDLFSHRAEEAAFLKNLLANVPEIIVAVDSTKLGRRHPWSFGGSVLDGKSVRLVTDRLTDIQQEQFIQLTARLARTGIRFRFEATSAADSAPRDRAEAEINADRIEKDGTDASRASDARGD